jgi:hypothetical protein
MTVSRNTRPMQFFLVAVLMLSAATAFAQQKQVDLLSNPDLKIVTLDVPGGKETTPMAIAPSGEIVREADGNIYKFDVPNSKNGITSAMNERGEITGYFLDAAGQHGFLLTSKRNFGQ